MTRQVRHVFNTVAEANAFIEGVEWVNDSDIECVDVEVGDDTYGPRATALCNDEYGDKDVELEHREGIPR